jgi:hypothetical protein
MTSTRSEPELPATTATDSELPQAPTFFASTLSDACGVPWLSLIVLVAVTADAPATRMT